MTSTNDGKDVKSNQTSGHKGKTYYIELYKSLEARLSGAGSVGSRTEHVAEAWRSVHTLCQHSAPSTHTHLLSWLQRHTNTTILQTEWQSPQSKDDHKVLDDAISAFIEETRVSIEQKNGLAQSWELLLLQRAQWLRSNLENPWGHPVLRVLLDPREEQPTEEQILEWLREERGSMFVTRLRQLASSKCDDLALSLAASVMDRVRATTTFRPDIELVQVSDKQEPAQESQFRATLTSEAGFTVDVWELLGDIEFVLLYKLDKRARCIELAKLTPLRGAYQLVERLRCRLETSPREKKLWKSSKDVAALIAQVVIARCMVVPQCSGVVRAALYCMTRALCRVSGAGLPRAAAALAAPAATSHHLHTLAHATHAQVGDNMKPFVCELYVRALTAGMNELERLKLKTEKEAEARATEKTLSSWFSQVGSLLGESARLRYECSLTAFSVHASQHLYERILTAPDLPTFAQDVLEPKLESDASDFGSWANDSRTQTNLVKTSEHLMLKQSQNHGNVLSTAILTEGETIGLGAELCQDLAVLLSGPRVKTLSWDMDRETLLENCRQYMERTNCGTRALTKELKFLNLDYSQYQHLPEEQDDTHLYYGIEKGYEHLVEFEPDPEEIWQSAVEVDKTETSSDDSEIIVRRRKKKKPKKPASIEIESDPLSLVPDSKKKPKKVRPHSKERSKDKDDKARMRKPKKQTQTQETKEGEASETTPSKEKKEKKPRKPRKKKEIAEPTTGSMSSLIGIKVVNLCNLSSLASQEESQQEGKTIKEFKKERRRSKKITKSVTGRNIDSQGKVSLASANSEGASCTEQSVVFDGLYSLDDIKSPERQVYPNAVTPNMLKQELNIPNRPVSQNNSPTSFNKVQKKPHEVISSGGLKRVDSEISAKIANHTVSSEVKNSINSLLTFRRQKALIEEKERIKSQMATSHNQQTQTDMSKIVRRTTKPPEPLINMNKNQTEQIQALADEVNNIIHKNIKRLNQPLDNTTNDRLLQLNNEIAMLKSLDRQNQQKNDSNRNTTLNPTPSCSGDGYKLPYSHLKVNTRPPDQVTQHQKSFELFLKDLQSSLNAGSNVDATRQVKSKSTNAAQRKGHLKDTTKKPDLTPQCAKIPQKKVENAPPTFSRLSYLHKNKQTDAKLRQDVHTERDLDKLSHDFKPNKVKYLQIKGEVNISRVPNSYDAGIKPVCESAVSINRSQEPSNQSSPLKKNNPLLAETLAKPCQAASSHSLSNSDTSTPQNYRTTEPQNYTSMSDKDQAELLLLLRQQSKLNNSISRSVKKLSQPTIPPTVIKSNPKVITEKLYTESTLNLRINQTVQSDGNSTHSQGNIHQTVIRGPYAYQPQGIEPLPFQHNIKKEISKTVQNDANNKNQDWARVMNDLLSHKTPYRGPNALNMALNKKPIKQTLDVLRDKVTKQTTMNECERNLNYLHNIALQNNGLQIKRIPSSKQIKVKSQTIIRPADDEATYQKVALIKQSVVPKIPDPNVSGNQSSDYDLLDDLLDDDLRKEIGELSSDEDTYAQNAEAAKVENVPIIQDGSCSLIHEKKLQRYLPDTTNLKHQDVINIQKLPLPSSSSSCTVPGLSAAVQQAIIIRQTQKNPMNQVPVVQNVQAFNSDIINTTNVVANNEINIINSENVYLSAPPPTVQNVIVMGPSVVYDPYSNSEIQSQPSTALCVNNTYVALNNAPNLSLYQSTRYAAPVINSYVIGNALTAQNSNTLQNEIGNLPVHTRTVQPKKSEIIEKTSPPSDPTDGLNLKSNVHPDKKYTNLDINSNKNCERKVLSQVQEKLIMHDKNLAKTNSDEKQHVISEKTAIRSVTTAQLTNHCDEEIQRKEQERLQKKRFNILNREISHHCHYPTIPLTYMPLKSLPISSSEETSYSIEPAERENTKENIEKNDTSSCRRILLRSSNKLKSKLETLPTKTITIKKVKLKSETPTDPKKPKPKTVKLKVRKTKTKSLIKNVKRRVSQRLETKEAFEVKTYPETEASISKNNDAVSKSKIEITDQPKNVNMGIEEELFASNIDKMTIQNKKLPELPDVVPIAEKTLKLNTQTLDTIKVIEETKLDSKENEQKLNENSLLSLVQPDNFVAQNRPTMIETVKSSTKDASMLPEKKVKNEENNTKIEKNYQDILPLEMEVTEEPAMYYSYSKSKVPDAITNSKQSILNSLRKTNETGIKVLNANSKSLLPQPIKPTDNSLESALTHAKPQTTDIIPILEEQVENAKEKEEIKDLIDLTSEQFTKPLKETNNPELQGKITYTQLPSSDPTNRIICVKLPNGKSYKATVRGNMAKMSLDQLFKDPTMRKHLLQNHKESKRYTVNIKQVSKINAVTKVINTTTFFETTDNGAPKVIDTVDLVSDEEIDESPQLLNTEYGVFKLKCIDEEMFKKHQSKLAQKSEVRLSKSFPLSFLKFPSLIPISNEIKLQPNETIETLSKALAEDLNPLIKSSEPILHDTEIIEIDDSSNDGIVEIESKLDPVKAINTYKHLLTEELFKSEEINCKIDALPKKEPMHIVTKKCSIPLLRCDDLVEKMLNLEKTAEEETINIESGSSSPKSTLSRCGSFSILNDFTEFELEPLPNINLEEQKNYRSSPVMEVFETIACVINKNLLRQNNSDSILDNCACDAEWLMTKYEKNIQYIKESSVRTSSNQSLQSKAINYECDSEVEILKIGSPLSLEDELVPEITQTPIPSLIKLVLKFFEDNPILYSFRTDQFAATNIKISSSLKRKSIEPTSFVSKKISIPEKNNIDDLSQVLNLTQKNFDTDISLGDTQIYPQSHVKLKTITVNDFLKEKNTVVHGLTQSCDILIETDYSKADNESNARENFAAHFSIKNETINVLKNVENIVNEEVTLLLSEMKPVILSKQFDDSSSEFTDCVDTVFDNNSLNEPEENIDTFNEVVVQSSFLNTIKEIRSAKEANEVNDVIPLLTNDIFLSERNTDAIENIINESGSELNIDATIKLMDEDKLEKQSCNCNYGVEESHIPHNVHKSKNSELECEELLLENSEKHKSVNKCDENQDCTSITSNNEIENIINESDSELNIDATIKLMDEDKLEKQSCNCNYGVEESHIPHNVHKSKNSELECEELLLENSEKHKSVNKCDENQDCTSITSNNEIEEKIGLNKLSFISNVKCDENSITSKVSDVCEINSEVKVTSEHKCVMSMDTEKILYDFSPKQNAVQENTTTKIPSYKVDSFSIANDGSIKHNELKASKNSSDDTNELLLPDIECGKENNLKTEDKGSDLAFRKETLQENTILPTGSSYKADSLTVIDEVYSDQNNDKHTLEKTIIPVNDNIMNSNFIGNQNTLKENKNDLFNVSVDVQSLDTEKIKNNNIELVQHNRHTEVTGIEYKDPIIGKCYVFAQLKINRSSSDCSSSNEFEADKIISVIKVINDDEIDDNSSEFSKMSEFDKRPKFTYSRECRKRKMCMRDVKITQKKYRKGKNIDYPKFTSLSMRQSAYVCEFQRLMRYYDSINFSYSRPYHKECLDIEELIKDWPTLNSSNKIPSEKPIDIQDSNNLFRDSNAVDSAETITDPMTQSLAEEISAEYKNAETSPDSISEINFEMGFGEGSDRVIQNLKNKDNVSNYSAATLSDVKQSQPCLLSEDYKQSYSEPINTRQIDDEIQKLRLHINYLHLRQNIRLFFENTTFINKDPKKRTKRVLDELCNLSYFETSSHETVVQVVQVGQLPVSAAAQNPVTCDPRVTQVSDASPSQCSIENSPRDDSQQSKSEYTELTTADLTLPLVQEYVQQNQNIMETQESASISMTDPNIPIHTELKSLESRDEIIECKQELNDSELKRDVPSPDNSSMNNIDYSFDSNNTSDSLESDPHIQTMLNSAQRPSVEEEPILQSRQLNGSSEKTDQIAHAMNAAGITTSETPTNTRGHALVNILSQKMRQSAVSTSQTSTTTNFTKTSINALALQQALAQILPPPLNQTNSSENNQQNQNPHPQVLHIVQGKNSAGNQITLVDNSQQSVISNANATQVLHIVQNKNVATSQTSNGTAPQQANPFSGLSLVDAGLQQGGNQLLHIVNTGNQKNSNAGQLLKRVNLLANLANMQGSNEQKMLQFVCKSADGKSIQLNAPHQRSMVLRLQPIEPHNVQTTPTIIKSAEPPETSPTSSASNSTSATDSQEIKSRSVYEENYAKFIQSSTTKPASSVEKSTSLPKFNQAFGKPVFQEGSQKPNETNGNNTHTASGNTNTETNEGQPIENSVNLDHIRQINSPPLLLRKSPAQTTQAQQNLVQQIKQTIAPMNIQTMHGGVIYTRQIPVNIGGGQTINLITVPSTELIDDPNQKSTDMESSIIKIVPQTTTNAESSQEEGNNQTGTNDSTPTPQPQQVLTQMRIKLPMLSKTPQMVPGARVVRPSFFQIQRNVIGGANQPVYQQLVLTAAPPLGQQTIRLPQTQPSRLVKVPSESQSSSESQMSSSTLEQLREFDMVLEQVKERSTVQPNTSTNSFAKLLTTSTDTTDCAASASSTSTETTQQVLYSIGANQSINVAYVNRKIATVSTPMTSSFVRSPDSTGIADSSSSSSHAQLPHTSSASTSDAPPQPKAAKVGAKKPRPKAASNPPNTLKLPTPAPKTSTQKPLEDEQTTQRILYILAEYKEQVENSPDKDKPAPRRRSNPPSNPGSSKRKKSSSGSRRSGRDMSPVHGEDTCRTMGSEDSSCGTSQGDCTESCLENNSPQDSPRKVVRKLTFEQETTPPAAQPRPQPQRNVIVADGQTITVARGTAGKPATAVLMPANYILPVSMMKGGQQIAIVTNRGPKLLTVGGGEGGTTNALLLQRLIGPAGLKPVLTRPGVRHVRLPTTALHNLQAFNIATTTTVQPPDSTASPAPAPTPELIETRANSSPWSEREAQDEPELKRSTSPEASEPWNLPSTDPHEYAYEETVRTDNMGRTVLDQIPDRYSPDMEAQRIFDKMFDVDSKKSFIVDSHDDSPRCAYDIDASDCDDKPYQQVVQKKDGTSQRQTRLTHVSAAALRHKYAILEHELRLQKSLSEECEDLGVDSPSASELFPEAELLFAASPAHDHSQPEHASQPTLLTQSSISQPDLEDHMATDELIQREVQADDDDMREDVNLGLEDVGIVTVSEDGMQATITLDQEEFARSHPNTTFHSEPTDVEVQPFTIAGIKGRQITSTIFHSASAPATVLMTTPQATVISQATADPTQNAVKFPDIDNMMTSLPSSHGNDINLSSVLVKDDGLTRFDSILNDSRELHLSNTASAIVHSAGNATQVIRRVYDEDKRERERFLMDETDGLITGDDPKTMSEDSSRDATMESMADVDDDDSSPERHAELFWESNSASERSESRRPLDFSSDSEKCCKSPSFDETNSTDSSGLGAHMRLDSVIKEARGGEGTEDIGPRTYPARRVYLGAEGEERSLSGKTRAGERSPDSGEVRRRASARGVVKRPCHCCNGSPAPPRSKKSRQRKPTLDFTSTD